MMAGVAIGLAAGIGISSDPSQVEAAGTVFVAIAGATSVTSSLPVLRTTYR